MVRVGLQLLEQCLDGSDLVADRLHDEVRTLTELADAVFGGTDTIVRIE